MKINICISDKHKTDGYLNVPAEQINQIINGSIDEILFRNIDSLDFNDRIPVVSALLNKMKYNGVLILEFLDLMSIGRDMSEGNITSKALSDLFSGINSVGYEFDFLEQLNNFPQYQVQNRYIHNNKVVIHIVKKLNN
jgi:hypothetical protein